MDFYALKKGETRPREVSPSLRSYSTPAIHARLELRYFPKPYSRNYYYYFDVLMDLFLSTLMQV